MNQGSVLIVFGQKLPHKSRQWWQQLEKVVGPKSLEEKIRGQGLSFVDIETLVNPGSIQKAYELSNKVSRLTFSDGSRVSKSVIYQGYELWWINYDSIYNNFCLPYTQYQNLLLYLKDFAKIYLFQPPWPNLFQYFLKAHGRNFVILNTFQPKKFLPIPFGVFVQTVLSILFLPLLAITRPKIMLWINDKFNYPYDFDFRKKGIYEELRKRKAPFVEFVRSLESWQTVLRHAWQRKRPVVYVTALITVLHSLIFFLAKNEKKKFINLSVSQNQEDYFWRLVATHYLHNIKGTVWSIRAMKFILQHLGIRSAIMIAGGDRTLHTVLGCKLVGIPTVGIQHGASPRYCLVSDFMPEFDGENPLSLDRYGLWSEWWREYYLKYSRAFKPEQLYISGSPRPLEREDVLLEPLASKSGLIRVLFVSEQEAEPKEVMPYLLTLLDVKDFTVSLKFRPQTDGFEEWLKKNESDILERVKTLKGDIHQAVSESDVVVGSYSTGVLEGFVQLKPVVFFRTGKWGDYYDIKSFDTQGRFFAENPKELINCIRKSVDVPKGDLKQLQERFFGNPYQNGSKWLVEQAIKYATPR